MLRCASAAKGWPSVAAWVRRRPRTKESPKTVGIMGRTIAEFGSASACGAVRRLMRRRSCAGAHGGAWRASRGRPLCGVARASPPATFDANQRAAFDHRLPQSTRARRVQNHMESDARCAADAAVGVVVARRRRVPAHTAASTGAHLYARAHRGHQGDPATPLPSSRRHPAPHLGLRGPSRAVHRALRPCARAPPARA